MKSGVESNPIEVQDLALTSMPAENDLVIYDPRRRTYLVQ